MDIEECMHRLREWAQAVANGMPSPLFDEFDAALAFCDLDEALSAGHYLPKAWHVPGRPAVDMRKDPARSWNRAAAQRRRTSVREVARLLRPVGGAW